MICFLIFVLSLLLLVLALPFLDGGETWLADTVHLSVIFPPSLPFFLPRFVRQTSGPCFETNGCGSRVSLQDNGPILAYEERGR